MNNGEVSAVTEQSAYYNKPNKRVMQSGCHFLFLEPQYIN